MVPDNISPTNQTVIVGPQGPNFPVQWNPRYAIAAGFGANPDHRESYDLNADGPRLPTVLSSDGFVVNPKDHPDGFTVGERFFPKLLSSRDLMYCAEGTLGAEEPQGVHSLTDVSVFANGPGSEAFRGTCE